MSKYTGVISKFIRFHCLENESNEKDARNTEGVQNFPNLPRASESALVVETETSPSKSLALMQVATVSEPISKDDVNVFA